MNIPLVLPFPIFFIYLFLKIMIILLTPFALGMIVRIRSQASDKRKVKANKNSDKVAPSQPSPSSDGEDKPEDSYWTRFKRWCSDHSLAIGLGISLVAATLIYVYREDISDLIYGSQPEEGRQAGDKPSSTSSKGKGKSASSEPTSLEGEGVSARSEAQFIARDICRSSFFAEGENIDGETFVLKAQTMGRQIVEMRDYYYHKEVTDQNDLVIQRKLEFFETQFPGIIEKVYITDENLEENITFAENQLNRKPGDRDPAFNKELTLLAQRKQHKNVIKLFNHFYEIVFLYVLEIMEQNPVATSDKN